MKLRQILYLVLLPCLSNSSKILFLSFIGTKVQTSCSSCGIAAELIFDAEIGGDIATCDVTLCGSFFSNGECSKFGMLFQDEEIREDFGFLDFGFKGNDDSKILAMSLTGMAELFGLQLRSRGSEVSLAFLLDSRDNSELESLGEAEASLKVLCGS